ncbi:MAG: DUF2188 domain-containing protein [Candidatus Sericytochromatia bacterium]|nr:DUF2188 domain-containing protein [Candidatus Sericytochromatia bacterium]
MDKINSLPNVSYATKEEAIKVAGAHKGSEAIIKNQDNKFELRELNPTEINNVAKRDMGKFGSATTIVAFSMDKEGTIPDKIINNLSGKSHKMYDIAENVFNNIAKGASTHYQHADKSLYNTDCSGFIRQLSALATGKNHSVFDGQNAAGICKTIRSQKGVDRIMKPADIKAGDVIAFKISNMNISGHAMLADDKPPVPIYNGNKIIGYNISIIDSTTLDHSRQDSRKKSDGVGKGTITIGVDKHGNANSVTWGPNFSLKNRDYHDITIGRLK